MNPDILKIAFYKPTKTNLKLVITLIDSLIIKSYKASHINKWITKCKWTDKEQEMWVNVQLIVLSEFLKFVLTFNDYKFKKYNIKSIIADISELFRFFNSNQNLEFIMISTNVLPAAIHFKHAKNLFLNKSLKEKEKRNSFDLLSIYGLRLSLEKRIKGIIGVDYIQKGGRIIGISEIIKIVKSMRSIEFSSEFNWDIITKINIWLNHYIHRNLRPYPWSIYKIFRISEPLLRHGVYKSKGKTYNHFYWSTVVKNEISFNSELTDKIENLGSDIEVKWLPSKDVLFIK